VLVYIKMTIEIKLHAKNFASCRPLYIHRYDEAFSKIRFQLVILFIINLLLVKF
jgi:hypothetical protein